MMAVTVLKPGTVAEALAIAVATTGETQHTQNRVTAGRHENTRTPAVQLAGCRLKDAMHAD
jgi:hypothetical protein